MKIKVVLLLVCTALIGANIACGDTGTSGLPGANAVITATPLSTETTVVYAQAIDGIVFAGKVESPNTGEWTNDRLVLLFLKSKEIARAVTSTSEWDANFYNGTLSARVDNGLGIADGLFILRIPNTYELNILNLGVSPSESPFVQVYDQGIGGMWHPYGLAAWMNPVMEG